MSSRLDAEDGLGTETGSFKAFMHQETSGAMVLLAAAAVALVIANSPFAQAYADFWHIEAGFSVGGWSFEQSLLHWVDDALMALFFFVVGLEIKREFIVGELSTPAGRVLPVAGALGGMIAPAAIYFMLNANGPGSAGWGVPMATDIAFALGVLALLGSRIPAGLKVFLSALAIADDIGAILVIAVFYTEKVSVAWLIVAVAPIAAMLVMGRRGVQSPGAYMAFAVLLWVAILASGIHATIAGVIAALCVPAAARITPLEFAAACRVRIDEIERSYDPERHILEDDQEQRLALEIARLAPASAAPLQRLEFALHPWTTFFVLPMFALANAGVSLSETGSLGPVAIGIALGLIIGKPLGIFAASWLAVRLGLGSLPSGVGWSQILGAGMLGGIGFTMSLFVANLAFSDVALVNEAKLAVLASSIIAGALGYAWLARSTPGGRVGA